MEERLLKGGGLETIGLVVNTTVDFSVVSNLEVTFDTGVGMGVTGVCWVSGTGDGTVVVTVGVVAMVEIVGDVGRGFEKFLLLSSASLILALYLCGGSLTI